MMDKKMLHLGAPDQTMSLEDLSEMCTTQMARLFPVLDDPDPISKFNRTQEHMPDRQFFALFQYAQTMCRIDMVGEYLPTAVATPRFERGLRLAILDARFSANTANDIGQHLTPAECVAANPKFSAPTVRAHIKLLQETGLIDLVSDPRDHRRKFIFPTRFFLHKYFVLCLTKMCVHYGLVFDSDRLAAATLETRWRRDFEFDPAVLHYGQKLVKVLYPSSRVIHVSNKERMAVIY